MSKTWGGRFTGSTDARVEAFTESISFDSRLARQDVLASQAHARMLAHVGLLAGDEATAICEALDAIGDDLAAGRMEFRLGLEDIHTHIEQALIERLGDVGRKLHTGRSRNDQVVTDVKLWVREAIDHLDVHLLHDRASGPSSAAAERRSADVVLPGYTHLQRAQPVLAAHYFLAYVEKCQRDRERLADCRKRVNVLPLGAAALAGTSACRSTVTASAGELGFDQPRRQQRSTPPATAISWHRVPVFDLSLIALHLSGWAEEWVLWATTEFGFLHLPDGFCTGSSIMPHKKNPDVLELTRGKCGRVVGALAGVLVLLKGLPLAYNRDLQDDKVFLFEAFDGVSGCLGVCAPLVERTTLNRERIAARLEDGFLDATTLMEGLIAAGVPMRTAHEAVGRLVKRAEGEGGRLADLPVEAFEAEAAGHGERLRAGLGAANAVAAFRSAGSTNPMLVAQAVAGWKRRLGP